MYEFMSLNPGSFVTSNEIGIDKVRKGGYAHLLESTSNEYIGKRECDLIQIGGLLDEKGYGLAGPSGSPLIPLISNSILKLQEYGEIQGSKN